MNTTINRQQWQEEEALRRFQLISPLLQTGLDDESVSSFAKRLQKKTTYLSVPFTAMKKLFRKGSLQG